MRDDEKFGVELVWRCLDGGRYGGLSWTREQTEGWKMTRSLDLDSPQ